MHGFEYIWLTFAVIGLAQALGQGQYYSGQGYFKTAALSPSAPQTVELACTGQDAPTPLLVLVLPALALWLGIHG